MHTAQLIAAVSPAAADLAERTRPSVVQVRGAGRGAGTGVVWGAGGVVLTNDHVVAGARGQLQVCSADGRQLDATVTARSAELDLALLQVPAADLPAAPIGDSTRLRVGELVFAVGHPWGQPWVVTGGIVSGLGEAQARDGSRSTPYIRSDVRLAPGNSGGPLLNALGEVVGINSMVFGGDLSIAIPSHVAVAWSGRPPGTGAYLGVSVQPAELPAELRRDAWASRAAGLLVVGVIEGGPAERAGLLIGDVLLDADGVALEAAGDLRAALERRGAGAVRLYLARGGALTALDVVPEAR